MWYRDISISERRCFTLEPWVYTKYTHAYIRDMERYSRSKSREQTTTYTQSAHASLPAFHHQDVISLRGFDFAILRIGRRTGLKLVRNLFEISQQ